MNTFLWAVVGLAFFNTVCILIAGIAGRMAQITTGARILDALITFGFGCWAFWLLK